MYTMILRMSLITIGMCLLTVILWQLERKTAFGKWSVWKRRITIGVLYGLAAVLSTHFGINYKSMVVNVRDFAPLAAGMFFDPWAGIIAGLIGGIERFIAGQYLGIGAYTRIACSISTILAGFFAAFSYKYLFEGKKPSALYSFSNGAIMEVFHMLAVLLTHLGDISQAFEVVRTIAAPMILFNAFGLMLTSFMLSVVSGQVKKGFIKQDLSQTSVTQRFQLWLLIFVTIALIITFSFTYIVQTRITTVDMQNTLKLKADDLEEAISSNSKNLTQATDLLKREGLAIAHAVAKDIELSGGITYITNEDLVKSAKTYNVYEIDVINPQGVITKSTNPDYIYFDMHKGEQSRAFLVLLDGKTTELVQDFQPIAYNSDISIMYIGVSTTDGFVQIGYDSNILQTFENLADITTIATDRHIGTNGNTYLIKDGTVISSSNASNGLTLQKLGINRDLTDGQFALERINSVPCYVYSKKIGDYYALLAVDKKEMYKDRDIFALEIAFADILLFAAIFILIYVLVRRLIVSNLNKVNESLARITNGNLNEVVNVKTSTEFTSLSEDINITVSALKKYIAEAENRNKKELEFAKAIQASALPSVFPPFPDHHEFDLYALMATAKEVGGDFYDFFLVDESHLALVMADVSGKGIPAALFMMKSKTQIKSLAESGMNPEKILETANSKLCEGNDAEMFVTVWIGILDIQTGIMTCSNAGHEFPVIKRNGGDFELVKDKHGFVLGGMDGAKYKEYQIEFQPGDTLFLYTDGVTEATDSNSNLWGTDRMLTALNHYKDVPMNQLLPNMKKEIDAFVGAAPQADDITMLGWKMSQILKPKEISLVPDANSVTKATEFAEKYFNETGVPYKTVLKLDIAIDEIVTNIYQYSGADKMVFSCLTYENKCMLQFRDNGTPYNPLDRADPDTTLSAEERNIGGLGIYMVKKSMDKMEYSRKNEENVLTLVKKF